jgi:purine-binding chemotaxis protein CheW
MIQGGYTMAVSENTAINQYLTFKLDEEFFTIEVSKVREVLELVKITKVPDSPPFMRGIINVRGSVVPVVDLKLKFGLPQTEQKTTTRIIVMEIARDDDLLVIGALADSVKEVIEMNTDQIEAAPEIGTRWNKDLIKGVGKHNEEFIIILDIDKIFSSEELSVFQNTENASPGEASGSEDTGTRQEMTAAP